MRLDIIDFCHPTLRHQLASARTFQKEEQDVKLGLTNLNKKQKIEGGEKKEAKSEGKTEVDNTMTDVIPAAAAASSFSPSSSSPLILQTETSGLYDLFAVITHKGRDADSGHYVGWSKESEEEWLRFDDDVVGRVKADEVKALSGGGDWHMAYVLFYKVRTTLHSCCMHVSQYLPIYSYMIFCVLCLLSACG